MPSLLEDARSASPGATDASLVIEIADRIVSDFALSPPISLEVVAGIQGIRRVERVALPHAACLVPGPDGAVIKLRASDSVARQNFSGFHEIGHTFMPGYELAVQLRCDPGQGHGRDPIEELCDLAASELLLPRRHFLSDIAEADLDFHAVDALADRYGASMEATARRLTSLWRVPALLLRLEVCNKPRDAPGAEPCLRAATYVPAGPICHSVSRYKSLASTDPLQAVLHDGAFSGLTRLHGLTDGSRRYWAEARFSPWTDPTTGKRRQRVLAMLRDVTRASSSRG